MLWAIEDHTSNIIRIRNQSVEDLERNVLNLKLGQRERGVGRVEREMGELREGVKERESLLHIHPVFSEFGRFFFLSEK